MQTMIMSIQKEKGKIERSLDLHMNNFAKNH